MSKVASIEMTGTVGEAEFYSVNFEDGRQREFIVSHAQRAVVGGNGLAALSRMIAEAQRGAAHG